MKNNLLELIGNTPIVKIPLNTNAKVYAKLEYLNPSGSVKDRSALFMIQSAEKIGVLKKGGIVIEASSGNQGISAGMIAAVRGYKTIITVYDKISEEKFNALIAYGAKVIKCPSTSFMEEPENYRTKALAIHKSTPNSILLDQYYNLDNYKAHYFQTGPEIYKQTKGKITHFFAAAGTCGTVCGVGKFLKEQNPNIKIFAVDSENSFRATKGNPKPYKIEGLGIDYNVPILEESIVDKFIEVSDDETFQMIRKLARECGFLVGPASGATAVAVSKFAKNLSKDDLVVTLFTDSGRAYLNKGFYGEKKKENKLDLLKTSPKIAKQI